MNAYRYHYSYCIDLNIIIIINILIYLIWLILMTLIKDLNNIHFLILEMNCFYLKILYLILKIYLIYFLDYYLLKDSFFPHLIEN